MGLPAQANGSEARGGLDEGGEDEPVERDAVDGEHLAEDGEGIRRAVGVGQSGEEGGVEEGIAMGSFFEDVARGGEEAAVGVGSEEGDWQGREMAEAGFK